MIKGHSTIELTDKVTGKKEIYDNDNMVTNALTNFLNTCGMWNNNVIKNVSANPLWNTLLGGILLFDAELEENANSIFPPISAKMVGNGSYNVANSGVVTELGSFNTHESGVQQDGSLKLVYDFSTQQANGTIRSVALTSASGGLGGYGNESSGESDSSKTTPFANYQSVDSLVNYKMDTINIIFGLDYTNDVFYTFKYDNLAINDRNPNYNIANFWFNSGKLVLYKLKANVKFLSIKDNKYLHNDVLATYDINVPDEIKTYMTSYYSTQFPIVVNGGSNKYVIFSKGLIANGSDFYVLKINDDYTTTTYHCINNCGESIFVDYGIGKTKVDGCGNLVTLNESRTKAYKINIADSTNCAEIAGSSGGKILFGIGNRVYAVDQSGYIVIYNTSSNKSLKTNYEIGDLTQYYFVPTKGNDGLFVAWENPEDIRLYKMSGYLATINNLQTPVVKTSSKTMKVTYTLTFE